MKNLFTLLAALFILSTTTSCSKDDIDPGSNLLGVWERNDFIDNSGYKLVFGSDNTGLKIYVNESSSGETTSSTSSFNWKAIDNMVTISESDFVPDDAIYLINSEGQLVLNDDLHFDKIWTCVHTYMYILVYIGVNTSKRTDEYTYTHISTYTYENIHIYIGICTYIYI